MVAIGPNLFYTITLPCTLWFFDKGKASLNRVSGKALASDSSNSTRANTATCGSLEPPVCGRGTVLFIDALHRVMPRNFPYEQEDVCRPLANHFGYRRITATVREPIKCAIKSTINVAIRRGVLDYKGELIWRAD